MFTALKAGLTGLLRFSGREGREPFWIYAGVVVGAGFATGFALMAAIMLPMFEKIERFAAEHPDQVTVERSAGSVSYQIHGDHPELMPDFGGILTVSSLIMAVGVLLLAASVVRRLHDTGRTGLWSIPPLVFLVGVFTVAPRWMTSFDAPTGPDFGALGLMFLCQMAYLGSLALLVFFMARRGTDGPNRYGPSPLPDGP